MWIDWTALSPPQAAVLAALVGVIAAVAGQLIGAVINTVASARQAKKNRVLDQTKFRLQLQYQTDAARQQRLRNVFVDFLAAAHATYGESILATADATVTLRARAVALADLDRASATLSLAGASATVVESSDELVRFLAAVGREEVTAEVASSGYRSLRSKCMTAMSVDANGASAELGAV